MDDPAAEPVRTGTDSALERAQALMAVGRWADARALLAPVLADPGADHDAWCLTAACLLATGDATAALTCAERAVARAPHGEWGHRLRALALSQLGRLRPAEAAARESARLGTGVPETLQVLAAVQLQRRRRRAAARTVELLLEQHPLHPGSHVLAADLAASRRRWAPAEAHLREALRLDGEDADAMRMLADVLRAQGRRAEAADVYLAAAHVDPTSQESREGLARLGLPVLGVGAVVALKVGIWQALHGLVLLRPGVAWALLAAACVVGAAVTTGLRLRGTRDLPSAVRRGLVVDHRDAALGWLRGFGVISVILGVVAQTDPARGTGSWGAVIILTAVASLVAARVLRVGPLPDSAGYPTFQRWWRRLTGDDR